MPEKHPPEQLRLAIWCLPVATEFPFLEEHPEVQEESQALSSRERNRSFAGRMIFNNAD